MDDLGPLGGDEADKPVERGRVGDERHLSAQRRHVDEPAATPPGVLEDRGVGLAKGDAERTRVARVTQRQDGRDGVLGGAPDGEARDQVEHADQRGIPQRGRSRRPTMSASILPPVTSVPRRVPVIFETPTRAR